MPHDGRRLHLVWSRLKAFVGSLAGTLAGIFAHSHWRHKKYLLPMLAIGGAAIVCAAVASFWLLEQRMESLQKQQAHKELKTVQPAQSLRPLPDAWEKVVDEIYSNAPNPTPSNTSPKVSANPRPQYEKNARELPVVPRDMPQIAIIIDDVGVNAPLSKAAEEKLPPEVTFSYLPYGRATKALVEKARDKDREVMIHLPMEPMPRPEEPPINPGDDALFINMSTQQIRATVRKNLGDLQRVAVGVNNHMGSRFTAYKEGMMPVLTEVDNAGLFFLDSLTTHLSEVDAAAHVVAPDMPLLVRDVFLDHTPTEDALIKTLLRLEDLAKKQGKVIAIGHPHKNTTTALANWIPTLKDKGIALVPISHMLGDDSAPKPPLLPAEPMGDIKKPAQTDFKLKGQHKGQNEGKDGLY